MAREALAVRILIGQAAPPSESVTVAVVAPVEEEEVPEVLDEVDAVVAVLVDGVVPRFASSFIALSASFIVVSVSASAVITPILANGVGRGGGFAGLTTVSFSADKA